VKDGRLVDSKGDICHYKSGLLHREDGPAIERADGHRYWCVNGELHREDGPAFEKADGTRAWWLNGKRHREDGPAVEWTNGRKEFWLDDQELTEEEFGHWLMKKQLNESLQAKLPGRPVAKRIKI